MTDKQNRASTEDLAELSASRQRQRLHFEHTPLAVIEWDVHFAVVEWNPAAERIFGYTRAEALGRHAAGLIVADEAREHVDRIWTQLLQQRGGLRSTNENERKDGKVIFCEWYNTPLVDEDGNVHGVASLVQDLTEQRRSETALRESEENLRITLDSIGDGVIATDANGRITRMNPVAEQLTGWCFADAREAQFEEVFRVRAVEAPESGVNSLVAGDGFDLPGAHYSLLLSRSGDEYVIADRSAPIRDRDGVVVGQVLVFRDETLKRSLAEQASRVQRLDAVGMLAGGIAHDFNNMLAGILGYSELLVEQLQYDKQLHTYAVGITKAAENAAELTGQLLAISHKGNTGARAIDAHDAIRDAVGLLRRSLDRNIELEMDLVAEESVVKGGMVRLQNAVLNLGVNARDAMPTGGALTVRTRNVEFDGAHCAASPFKLTPGRYLRISVIDDGEGIADQHLEHVFDPFYSTKEIGKGTGLGLAAVHGTVTGYHGAITIESEPGKGTTFFIDLPLCDAPTANAEPRATEDIQGAGLVLVVDDESIVREATRALVEDLGYRTLLATDGADGLRVFQEHRAEIDAVILDVVMPKMNGCDCLRELRRIDPQTRILLCSGYPSVDGLPELLENARTLYMQKPILRQDLGLALQSVLSVSD